MLRPIFVWSIPPTHLVELQWNFIEMFTTLRSRVAHMNQVSRSKVKVTEVIEETLVRRKTSTCIEGFQYNLAQMFTIVKRSVTCKIMVLAAKRKVSYRRQSSDKDMKMFTTIRSHVAGMNQVKGQGHRGHWKNTCSEQNFYIHRGISI
jgi:hypothetical protein